MRCFCFCFCFLMNGMINIDAFSEKNELSDYSVVMICIDTLRADHLGAYGYQRPTSPVLDAIAKEGILFEQAYSTSSFTRESVSSVFTGLLPSHGKAVGWSAAPAKEALTIAELFQQRGYPTAFFCNNTMLKKSAFRQGFSEYSFRSRKSSPNGGSPLLVKKGLDFLKKQGGKPSFLYLQTLDPHGPYNPPDEYYTRFSDTIYPKPIQVYKDLRDHFYSYKKAGFGVEDPRFKDLVVRYDGEIAFVDNSLKTFFEGLERLKLSDKTIVILMSDHGEEFLDHGFVEHAWTLYNECIHVPLIFWAPKLFQPTRVATRVSLVDLFPSLCQLLGMPYDELAMDGKAFIGREKDGTIKIREEDSQIIAELQIQARTIKHAVIQDDWKYIMTQKWIDFPEREKMMPNLMKLTYAYSEGRIARLDPWGAPVKEELYHLSSDPGEKKNLIRSHPEAYKKLRGIMDAYAKKCQGVAKETQKEEAEESASQDDIEAIKALGYL